MQAIKKRTVWDKFRTAAWVTGKKLQQISDKLDEAEVKLFGAEVDQMLDGVLEAAINKGKQLKPNKEQKS